MAAAGGGGVAATAAAGIGIVGGVGGAVEAGGSTGGGGGGGGGGVGGGMAFSLAKVDLAFPNNEHLLPISSFSTEQGLTVPSSSSQVGAAARLIVAWVRFCCLGSVFFVLRQYLIICLEGWPG